MDCCEAFKILSVSGDNPEFYEAQLSRHDSIYEEMLRRAAVGRGARVLDLGTGTGPVAIKLAQRVGPEGKVFGLDVNRKMLRFAKIKAIALALANIEFKLMSMEELRFPADSFDNIVSSYGICCCFHYDRTLTESFRVLRRGGRIIFSQSRPRRYPVQAVCDKVFSKYKTKRPSPMLKKRREASRVQEMMVRKFQRVSPTLALMKKVGFTRRDYDIGKVRMIFSTPEDYLDYVVSGSCEYDEMTSQVRSAFKAECLSKLARFQTADGFVVSDETAYFSGVR